MDTDNEHKLRRRMQRDLGRRVSDAVWGVAVRRDYVREALRDAHGDAGLPELRDFLADLLEIRDGGLRAPASTRHTTPVISRRGLQSRIEAVSRLAADHAAGDAEILRYRREFLGRDTPMSPEEAEAYLDAPEARATGVGRSGSGRAERLRYLNRHVDHDIGVAPGSPLDNLRALSERLCDSYPWRPAQAAAFVLEGLIPLATPFMLRLPYRPHEDRPWRARIVMEVDLWMPAEVVVKAYRQAQRRVLPGHNRPISPRSVDLVNFVQRLGPATWQTRLDAWNSEHSDRAFPDYRALRTAYERASRSLLTPRYRPAVADMA